MGQSRPFTSRRLYDPVPETDYNDALMLAGKISPTIDLERTLREFVNAHTAAYPQGTDPSNLR